MGVLPLRNLSADPDDDLFADAMTDEVTTRLARVSSLRVVSHSSVMQFKDTRVPMSEIGRVLGVDALVAGAIVRSGDRVRVTAQLIEAAADRHLWADSYERDLCDVLALQHDVAVPIAGEVPASPPGPQRLGGAPPPPLHPDPHFPYLQRRARFAHPNA